MQNKITEIESKYEYKQADRCHKRQADWLENRISKQTKEVEVKEISRLASQISDKIAERKEDDSTVSSSPWEESHQNK